MNFDCNGFIWYQIWPLVKDSLYSRTIVYVPVVSIHAYTLPIALWPCRPEGYCSCLHPSICFSIRLYEFVCTIDQERFFKCFLKLGWNTLYFLHIIGPFSGEPPMTGGFSLQKFINAEVFSCHDITRKQHVKYCRCHSIVEVSDESHQ